MEVEVEKKELDLSASENGALSFTPSKPSSVASSPLPIQTTDSTPQINTAGPDSSGAITAQLNASGLLEILGSILAAANTESPGVQTSSNESGENTSLPQLPIQLQLQLNPSLVPVPQVATPPSSTTSVTVQEKGKGSVSRSQGKGKEKQSWHYHLGGVRQRRVPLSPEIKEALEVAYVSRIMSKNFRKEGQPEKERISQITGLEIEKVHEWFKNRRKKDKLMQSRSNNTNFPRSKRGRKPILPHSMSSPQS